MISLLQFPYLKGLKILIDKNYIIQEPMTKTTNGNLTSILQSSINWQVIEDGYNEASQSRIK